MHTPVRGKRESLTSRESLQCEAVRKVGGSVMKSGLFLFGCGRYFENGQVVLSVYDFGLEHGMTGYNGLIVLFVLSAECMRYYYSLHGVYG